MRNSRWYKRSKTLNGNQTLHLKQLGDFDNITAIIKKKNGLLIDDHKSNMHIQHIVFIPAATAI